VAVAVIADDVSAALPILRAEAESLMLDACTISRKTGTSTDADGVVTDTYGDPFYSGKCKVQVRDVDPKNPEAGDRAYTILTLRVDVPVSVTGVETNDRITITGSTFDPDLVGRNFRVVAPFHGSLKTARRLPVEETP
jgi:hypothetical protein